MFHNLPGGALPLTELPFYDTLNFPTGKHAVSNVLLREVPKSLISIFLLISLILSLGKFFRNFSRLSKKLSQSRDQKKAPTPRHLKVSAYFDERLVSACFE